jgi:hypothetical protein
MTVPLSSNLAGLVSLTEPTASHPFIISTALDSSCGLALWFRVMFVSQHINYLLLSDKPLQNLIQPQFITAPNSVE